jgi:hypothetical protein
MIAIAAELLAVAKSTMYGLAARTGQSRVIGSAGQLALSKRTSMPS